LGMSMLRHFAAGLEAREHLIHRLSTRHGPAFDSRANVDPRIFVSHKLSLRD